MLIKERKDLQGRIEENYFRLGDKNHKANKVLAKMGLLGNGFMEGLIEGVVKWPKIMVFSEREHRIDEVLYASHSEWTCGARVVVVYKESWPSKISGVRGESVSICVFDDQPEMQIIYQAQGRDRFAAPRIINGKYAYAQRHECGGWEFFVDDRYIESARHEGVQEYDSEGFGKELKRFQAMKAVPDKVSQADFLIFKKYIKYLLGIQKDEHFHDHVGEENGYQLLFAHDNKIVLKNNKIFWIRPAAAE